jgi:predicted RNase H-like HicB family nuclease
MKVVGVVHKDVDSCFGIDVDSCYGIYFPQVPGCSSAGDTLDEVKSNGRDALEVFKEEGMLPDFCEEHWEEVIKDLHPDDIEDIVTVLIFDI